MEREVETQECWKLVKQSTSKLVELLIEPEKDIEQISQVAKESMERFNTKVQERNFKRLSRFDI